MLLKPKENAATAKVKLSVPPPAPMTREYRPTTCLKIREGSMKRSSPCFNTTQLDARILQRAWALRHNKAIHLGAQHFRISEYGCLWDLTASCWNLYASKQSVISTTKLFA